MVEIAHLKHCQKQSNLNNLDGKITSTVNLMPEIVSHCVPPALHTQPKLLLSMFQIFVVTRLSSLSLSPDDN